MNGHALTAEDAEGAEESNFAGKSGLGCQAA